MYSSAVNAARTTGCSRAASVSLGRSMRKVRSRTITCSRWTRPRASRGVWGIDGCCDNVSVMAREGEAGKGLSKFVDTLLPFVGLDGPAGGKEAVRRRTALAVDDEVPR